MIRSLANCLVRASFAIWKAFSLAGIWFVWDKALVLRLGAYLPALLATDASALYARNVLDFLKLVIDAEGRYAPPVDDDIVNACLVCKDGQVLRSA